VEIVPGVMDNLAVARTRIESFTPTVDLVEAGRLDEGADYATYRGRGTTDWLLIQTLAGARGHRIVVGTPDDVADEIERWFTCGAADGFNVMPALLPSGLSEFAETVIPLLQDRGLFRREYTTRTLRECYGLDRSAVGGPRSTAVAMG